MSDNALADLGLDDTGADAGSTVEATQAPVEAAAAKAPRKQVNIGELVIGEEDFIPAMKKGGEKGSKFAFDKLAAPRLKDDGVNYAYATFTAMLQDGEDEGALKRSVQSATTAQNRQAKANNEPQRFVTRSKVENGEFVGITVYRVDGTIDTEE